MKKCSVENCDRKHYGKGLCVAHWGRMYRKGDISQEIPIKNIKKTLLERFKEKIADKDINGCMNWIGCQSNGRYGAFITGSRTKGTRKRYNAHRLSYELFVGKIPKALCVLHKCDNVLCVNPEHLFLGTQADNMKDMISKGRDFHVIPFGSKHGNAKLDEEKVKDIKIKLINGMTCKQIAEIYNVSITNIRYIKNSKSWKHITI